MDTLCKDLQHEIFKLSRDKQIVYPFLLLYGGDYLQFKRTQLLGYIDLKLDELFGDKRYDIFTENSVLTGSLLLKLILEENWECEDVDIISTKVDIDLNATIYKRVQIDYQAYIPSIDPSDQVMMGKLLRVLRVVACNYYRFNIYNTLNIITIDNDSTTIDEHINRFDFSFVKNYAFYKNKKLQVHISYPANVFGRFGDFNTSMAIWLSGKRYIKYRERGFNIIWTDELINTCVVNHINMLLEKFNEVDVVNFLTYKGGFGQYALRSIGIRLSDYNSGLSGVSQLIITYIRKILSESDVLN